MNGQISMFDYLESQQRIEEEKEPEVVISTPAVDIKTEALEYGYRGCKGCQWLHACGRCMWAVNWERPGKELNYTYPTCDNTRGHFQPHDYKIPGMCANCKYSNDFHYQTKPEHIHADGSYCREAADDPVEEPDIYCTHKLGSLNRRTAYKDLEKAGFGVGHWHCQHAWDTCDRWEPDWRLTGGSPLD